jgi:hypothetical protein
MKRELKVWPVGLNFTATDSDRLMGVLEMFNSVVPCTLLTFKQVSDPGIEPKVFMYKIEAIDGRVWKQHITFDNLGDPFMTFEVIDPWRLSQFSNQRNVRNTLVALVSAYPTLEKITYTYSDVV